MREEKSNLNFREKCKDIYIPHLSSYHDVMCLSILCSFFSQHSNLLNQARLAVLKSRDDHVKRIIEEAKSRLDDITRDDKKWKKVLQDLITQVCGT